jgi:uncharacterized protein (TIGR03067 family)
MSLQMLALAVGLLGAAGAPKDEAAAKDTKALQGTWVVASATVKGQGIGVAAGNGGDIGDGLGTMTFAGEKWTFKLRLPGNGVGGVQQDDGQGTFTVNPSTSPKRIEIRAGGKVVRRGVYSLQGDRLTLRLNRSSDKQPEYPQALEPENNDAGVALGLERRVKKDNQ